MRFVGFWGFCWRWVVELICVCWFCCRVLRRTRRKVRRSVAIGAVRAIVTKAAASARTKSIAVGAIASTGRRIVLRSTTAMIVAAIGTSVTSTRVARAAGTRTIAGRTSTSEAVTTSVTTTARIVATGGPRRVTASANPVRNVAAGGGHARGASLQRRCHRPSRTICRIRLGSVFCQRR